MSIINRYIDNQLDYIAEKKKQPLIGFTNPTGEQATWDDIAITFTDIKGKKINFCFNNKNQPNANIGSKFTQSDRIETGVHELIFAYALDVVNEKIGHSYKKDKVTTAKYLLLELNENISSVDNKKIQLVINKMKNPAKVPFFINWLHKHKMVPLSIQPIINIRKTDIRSKYGDDALIMEKSKLPNEKVLLALGAIFYDVIPSYKDDKNGSSSLKIDKAIWKSQRDSFVCTMAALAMASPNRAAAEQCLLTNQRLHSHVEELNGEKQTVYYLNWRGSKGYNDYQNHINAEMAESIDKALHYTSIVTEPARVLARFYKKPSLALECILKDFQPSPENMRELNPAMDKPTNLIHLGFLLGFFDGTDKNLRVTSDTKGSINITRASHQPKYIKPIVDLTLSDKLFFAHKCPYTKVLTGNMLFGKRAFKKYSAGKKELTVSEFQSFTIKSNQENITGYNRSQKKFVTYENALFTYTESQLNSQSGSPFYLKPISSLGLLFSKELSKNKSSSKSIFERHGFSSDFSISPHQFRHWQNDLLDKNGLPHILISMLSGRKSVEQTLTYIHTTDAQNSSVISDILFKKSTENEVNAHISKRLQSKSQYDEAIENLSPTLVTEVGFCVQNLTLSPCTYMTEFETQCTLCPSSCHITHDTEAIDLLKKDIKIQTHNLKKVSNSINFSTSNGMQKWYKTHYKNTSLMRNLVEVLSDTSIKEGCIVRYISRSNTMRITDLDTKAVKERKLSLPDVEKALRIALNDKTEADNDTAKSNLLSFVRNSIG